MANMSYCRFRNTEEDINECLDALKEQDIQSEVEKNSARRIFENVLEFCCSKGIIDNYDSEYLHKTLENCMCKEEEEEIEEEYDENECSACGGGGCVHCEPHRFVDFPILP